MENWLWNLENRLTNYYSYRISLFDKNSNSFSVEHLLQNDYLLAEANIPESTNGEIVSIVLRDTSLARNYRFITKLLKIVPSRLR